VAVLGERPNHVLVVGDVNSTVACLITAKRKGISVSRIEAGLLTFDLTMPEKINRIVTDLIAD
jgi:UDP-N-acetylglucosamine 2-epimerase (non-hydrolysing)